jgi:AcrR family transcriptional regulator
MRARLYEIAIGQIAARGYDGATLRDVAAAAGVSPALLYRYFPNKQAVVLALYDKLSHQFVARSAGLPNGRWRDRALHSLALSLDVLRPHRAALRALAPVLVGDPDDGLFADRTAFSRMRVQGVFERAACEATDAPAGDTAGALGRLLYLLHLGVILWWLLDRSADQRATRGLLALLGRLMPSAMLALKLPSIKRAVLDLDRLMTDGLVGSS